MSQLLTADWIVPPGGHAPLGYGATAHSLNDALQLIRGLGHELPDDLGLLAVAEGIRVADLEHPHVREHMGPIAVRGLWYPSSRVAL